MEPFAILMLLGVRVREVRDLEEGHVWMPRRKLLIIDRHLGDDERLQIAEHFADIAGDIEGGLGA